MKPKESFISIDIVYINGKVLKLMPNLLKRLFYVNFCCCFFKSFAMSNYINNCTFQLNNLTVT